MKLYDKAGREIGEIYEETTEGTEELISKERLKRIFYNADGSHLSDFYDIFNNYAKSFVINTEVRVNFFLAQVVAEIGYDLISKRENLNYTPTALVTTFSRYSNNPNWADRDGRTELHAARQESVGNVAYADRLGNGDIESGDGYKYRGGGMFQLTGKGNYDRNGVVIQQTIGEAVDGSNVVSEIETTAMGTLSAMAFWLDNECYKCENIDCVTQKINRYTDSYQKRKEIYLWIVSL